MLMTPRELHEFWFGDVLTRPDQLPERLPLWFLRDESLDRMIREEYAPWLRREKELESWAATSQGTMALVLLYDQIPRNAFRGTPNAFHWDQRALALARSTDPRPYHPLEQFFLALPFEHSERLEDQDIAVERMIELHRAASKEHKSLFEAGEDMARRHRDAIKRFGHFPHRNAILGRQSSPVEIDFLKDPRTHF